MAATGFLVRRAALVTMASVFSMLGVAAAGAAPRAGDAPLAALTSGDAGLSPQSVLVQASAESVEPTPAELQDLTVMAAEEGLSLDVAISRYAWQNEFADAVQSARLAYAEQFAGAELEGEGEPRGVVRFKGQIPSDIRPLFTGLPVPVEIRGGALLSEREVRAAVGAAHAAARRLSPGLTVSTEFDEDTERVISHISFDSEQDGVVTPEQVLEAMRLAVAEEVDGATVGVAVSTMPSSGAGEDTIRGGGALYFPGTTSLACTAGWPVASTSTTVKGLVTADHCPNDLTYFDRDVLTYVRRLASNNGDMQYMKSSETVGTTFYYDFGLERSISGLSSPVVDQYLCKFGRASGATCDYVRDTYTCRGEYCNLVSMDNRKAAAGDSGGPWYYGNTAYGVHSGYHTYLLKQRDQWTPVYNTLSDLGVKLNR